MDEAAERRCRNLEAIRLRWPSVHATLEGFQPQSALVWDGEDGPDLELRGQRLIGKGAYAFAREQIDKFFKNPERIFLGPPGSDNVDDFAGEYLKVLLRRSVDAGLDFLVAPTHNDSFHLILFGVGLGGHIQELASRTNCRNLILIEPNLELLYHSLSVFDWESLIKEAGEKKMNIELFIEKSPENISFNIRQSVRKYGISMFDGTYLFVHTPSATLTNARAKFCEESRTILTGLGFFLDEMGMVSATFKNLMNGKQRVYDHRQKSRRQLPAFIIGSGPSLDGALNFLKANQDKAIVISCGTSLRPLLAHGIRPDFHMELERGTIPFELMSDVAADHDLSGITLVASTTCDPGLKTLFDRTIFYFREALSSFPLFGSLWSRILYPGPTVTNTGLSFAREMNFREIYFFGMDLGTKDPNYHHSKGSDYLRGRIQCERVYNVPISGNFGGTVLTGTVLLWAREQLQTVIKRNGAGCIFYNCSDGAFIEGSRPRHMSTIDLPPKAELKKRTRQDIIDAMPIYQTTLFDRCWENANLIERLRDFYEVVKTNLDRPHDNPRDNLEDVLRHIAPCEHGIPASEILINRGSMFMALIAAEYYLKRVHPPERQKEFFTMFAEEFLAMCGRQRDHAVEVMTGLETLRAEAQEGAPAAVPV